MPPEGRLVGIGSAHVVLTGRVPRTGSIRTASGPEGSSAKDLLPGVAVPPGPSRRRGYLRWARLEGGARGRASAFRLAPKSTQSGCDAPPRRERGQFLRPGVALPRLRLRRRRSSQSRRGAPQPRAVISLRSRRAKRLVSPSRGTPVVVVTVLDPNLAARVVGAIPQCREAPSFAGLEALGRSTRAALPAQPPTRASHRRDSHPRRSQARAGKPASSSSPVATGAPSGPIRGDPARSSARPQGPGKEVVADRQVQPLDS
jgi:hypothetical protein